MESNRPFHAGATRHVGRGGSRLDRIVRTLSPSEGRNTCLSQESSRRKDSKLSNTRRVRFALSDRLVATTAESSDSETPISLQIARHKAAGDGSHQRAF